MKSEGDKEIYKREGDEWSAGRKELANEGDCNIYERRMRIKERESK